MTFGSCQNRRVTTMDPAVVAWAESVIGSTIIASQALVGGMSSQVHKCELANGTAVVVRHIADTTWLQREPGLIHQERQALELLNGGRCQHRSTSIQIHLPAG